MKLKLEAFALNDQPLSQPLWATFDEGGGTIGRADQNTLTLPDPRRHISRLQARVIADGTGFTIRNIGSANPISVRGQVLLCDASTTLLEGDHIRIGGYSLRAANGSTQGETPMSGVQREAAAIDTVPPAFEASHSRAAVSNDVFGLAGLSSGRPSSGQSSWQESSNSSSMLGSTMPSGLIPDDFDPFAEPARGSSIHGFTSHVPTALSDVPLHELVPTLGSTSLDAMFGLQEPVDDMLAKFTRDELPPPMSTPVPVPQPTPMPMMQSGVAQPRPQFQAQTQPSPPSAQPAQPASSARSIDPFEWITNERSSNVQSKPTLPRAITMIEVPEATELPMASLPDELSVAALPEWWTAFCEGAAIPADSNIAPSPEQMRHAGAALREAVEGLTRLLHACNTLAPLPDGDVDAPQSDIETALAELWKSGDLAEAPRMIERAFAEFVELPQGTVLEIEPALSIEPVLSTT